MKDEILQTSLKQFLKYGIREMSIQKLVAPLGISTKTVYKYFKNKEELLAASLKLFFSEQYKLLEDLSTDQNPVTLLFDIWYKGIEMEFKVNKKFFHDLHRYYPELDKITDEINGKKFWKQFIQIIYRGIKEGVFREDISPEILLDGIAVLYVSIVRKDQFKKFRVTPYEILQNTITLSVRGICTSKGIRKLDEHIAGYTLVKKQKASST